MKSVRGKLMALLGAGMVFQVGGCAITDVVGEAFIGLIPDLLAGVLGGMGG